jgi:hypothetical protein
MSAAAAAAAAWEARRPELIARDSATGSLPAWDHPSGLGRWAAAQRRAKAVRDVGRAGGFSAEQVAAMEAMPRFK